MCCSISKILAVLLLFAAAMSRAPRHRRQLQTGSRLRRPVQRQRPQRLGIRCRATGEEAAAQGKVGRQVRHQGWRVQRQGWPAHRQRQEDSRLYTAKEFNKDFHLKFEFRTVADKPKNNSGLFLRGPQLQLDATNTGGLTGAFRNVKNFKVGDWNEIDVTVKGTSAVCLCNGEMIMKKPMQIPATGTIGLQSEYGQFEFRRIRIKELP